MIYKSEKQKKALQKQVKFLQEFNKLFTPVKEKQIKYLYKKGLSCNQIAKKYNCSKSPILRIIKNLPKRKATDYKNHKAYNQWGKNNSTWRGGVKSIYDRIRGLSKYWEWRNSIIKRDNNACIKCKSTKSLEVHHKTTLKFLVLNYCKEKNCKVENLIDKDLLSEYFYDINNGVTYCKKCHREYHKKNGR